MPLVHFKTTDILDYIIIYQIRVCGLQKNRQGIKEFRCHVVLNLPFTYDLFDFFCVYNDNIHNIYMIYHSHLNHWL